MASIRLKQVRDDGSKVYEIIAARTRGESMKTMRWTAKAGLSQTYIDRMLKKISEEFDRKAREGEVLTRAEKAEKERAAAEAEAQILTVRKYVETLFLPHKQNECAPRTMEYYRSMFARYIFPVIGNKKMTSIQALELKRLLSGMQSKGLGFATIRHAYLTLSQMFRQAVKDDVLDINPMLKVDSPKRRKDDPKREITIFSDEEWFYIRSVVDQESLRWNTFINILMDTGARKGEICALRWDAIDFNTGRVFIYKNAVRIEENGDTYVKVVAPKNGKSRYNILSPYTMQLLEQLREIDGSFEYVFPQYDEYRGQYGMPIVPNSVDAFLRKFIKKHDIQFKCNPHKFRHTVISYLVEMGFSIADVALYVGDTEETIVRYYVHPKNDAVERAALSLHSAYGHDQIYKKPTQSQHGLDKTSLKVIVNDSL